MEEKELIFIFIAFLFFMLGFVFSYWVLDIINGLVKLLLTKLEAASGKDSLKIAKINNEINSIPSENSSNKIGFQFPIELEEGEEENDL